jgi:capsular exopolysaccharide synthesis family protein
MTRLKDALDKAAACTDDSGESGNAGQFSHPPRIVPDAWQFDALDTMLEMAPAEVPLQATDALDTMLEMAPGEVPLQAADALETMLEMAPAQVPLQATDAQSSGPAEPDKDFQDVGARPNPSGDFWATYRFGKPAMGKVVVGPSADPGLVEQYRRLGAALHHHQLQGAVRTLMVTSAVAVEGKTLTATNLALTLSHSYMRRVLLIDADLRRPGVHKMFGLPNTIGLSDRLRNPDRYPLQFQTVSPTLSVLTAGRADADPMAGLVSDTMSKTLLDAAEQFDWVIVDTPPVALLTDANLLAAMIDTALLVVGANTTPYPMVRRAVDAIGEQRILGVVLNRMAKSDMVSDNAYGYGLYRYGLRKKPGRRLFFWKHKEARTAAG